MPATPSKVPERLPVIRRYAAKGWSKAKISRTFGMPEVAILKIATRYNIEFAIPEPARRDFPVEKMIQMRLDGASFREIGLMVGVGPMRIGNLFRGRFKRPDLCGHGWFKRPGKNR